MAKQINLDQDWEDYDNRKKKKEDRLFFSCDEKWEVDYLRDKIYKKYPEFSKADIEIAIGKCCNSVPAPRPRKDFVECVMSRLSPNDGNPGGGNPPPNPGPGPKNPPSPPGDRKVG